jgi:membrane associated rhomboid family serine protease
MLIPIRTESPIKRTPWVNIGLITVNVIVFMLYNQGLAGKSFKLFVDTHFVLDTAAPRLHQFVTYQFLHGDFWHLFGNMLFLWVFGNSVNGKMRDLPYLLFYLAGGIFSGWLFVARSEAPTQLIGASGAIAAVTTAYLALFPRSRVRVLFLFFFITWFDLPAMVIIIVKIIIWDNILAPSIGPAMEGQAVAHSAHLAGYLFGFATSMGMLLLRVLPRDQFDMLALWKRWHQRQQFRRTLADPEAAARARFGSAARVPPTSPQQQAQESTLIDELTGLRAEIHEKLGMGDDDAAASLFEALIEKDPQQCMPERDQLRIAREFYASGRYPQAAAAFDRFVTRYPESSEANDVRLLLGIIYARDLQQYDAADKHLTESMKRLKEEGRRAQCLDWLKDVRAALGRPQPEG